MPAFLCVLLGLLLLPAVATWTWRMQRYVVRSLIPGAEFGDVASAADLPVIATLQGSPAAEDGPFMHLLMVTREATALFIAYRPVASVASTAKTLLLDFASAGRRELNVLTRWQARRTPLVVRADLVARSVAIQEPLTRLTVTLSLLG